MTKTKITLPEVIALLKSAAFALPDANTDEEIALNIAISELEFIDELEDGEHDGYNKDDFR